MPNAARKREKNFLILVFWSFLSALIRLISALISFYGLHFNCCQGPKLAASKLGAITLNIVSRISQLSKAIRIPTTAAVIMARPCLTCSGDSRAVIITIPPQTIIMVAIGKIIYIKKRMIPSARTNKSQ